MEGNNANWKTRKKTEIEKSRNAVRVSVKSVLACHVLLAVWTAGRRVYKRVQRGPLLASRRAPGHSVRSGRFAQSSTAVKPDRPIGAGELAVVTWPGGRRYRRVRRQPGSRWTLLWDVSAAPGRQQCCTAAILRPRQQLVTSYWENLSK